MQQLRHWRTGQLATIGALGVAVGLFAIGAAWSLREVAVDNTVAYPQIAGIASYDIVALTNEERAERDLPALTVDPLLTKAAQLKADDMAKHEYYAHIGPDGKGPVDWIKQAGYRHLNAGENLVIDRTSAGQAVSAWMGSQAHRENILRPQFTQFGVGVAEGRYKGQDTIFVVQVFGTPYPSTPVVRKPQPASPEKPKPAATSPITLKPVQLPSLAPEATATSTLPQTQDPLVNRVTDIVRPAARGISVDNVPTTTITAATTSTSTAPALGASTLVTMPGWNDLIEFIPVQDTAGTTNAGTGDAAWFALVQERFQARLGMVRGWASGVPRLWE
jgi:hypothetical protein